MNLRRLPAGTSRVGRLLAGAAVASALTVALAACGGSGSAGAAGSAGTGPVTLRLGYFPNVTHAVPIVADANGYFAKALAGRATLKTSTFNAGPAAIEAIFSDAVDATYVGPNPTVNGYVKSKGEAVRVVAGAASGGAALVVRAGIGSAADLRGRTLATPQLGNTQDVALRYWLKQQGLTSTLTGGGDVKITPQENPQIVDAFNAKAIDGAWVPEPYATRLVKAGGSMLVDEKTLWPAGRFVTTNLIVNPKFLEAHPDVVKGLLEGQVAATEWINAHPVEAQKAVNTKIAALTGRSLPDDVISAAWKNLAFTDDPVASSLVAGAKHAADVGVLQGGAPDLSGLYDLAPLNEVLKAKGLPEVKAS